MFRVLTVALLFLCAGACADSPPLPQAIVHPGESIQAALLRMPPSATSWLVEVRPGVYHETVAVDRAGVTLRGVVTGSDASERPILDGMLDSGGRLLQDAVVVNGAHFTMQGFTIRSYGGSGVFTSRTRDITLRDLYVDHAGRYGLYPSESEDVLIDSCQATGHSGAGIYVSQSRRVTVQGSRAFANAAAIRIENSVAATVQDSEAFDNTAGILALVLPGGASKIGQDCTLRNNRVHDNSRAGELDLLTKVPAQLLAGVGIAVVAGEHTVVAHNQLSGNRSLAVALLGLTALGSDPASIDVAPEPQRAELRDNTYQNNGTAPDPALTAAGFAGGDILWDGSGAGSCLDEAQDDTLTKVGRATALPRCS